MVAGVALKIAQIGLQKGLPLAAGAVKNFGKGALGVGKGGAAGLLGYIAGAELLKHTVINPVLGATGLYYHAPSAAPGGVAPQGVAGMGMTPSQQQFMYGSQGFSLPWQSQEGYLDRQLRQQKEMFMAGQDTLRAANQNNYRLGMAGLSNQYRTADLMSNRQLQGIQDTNATRLGLADRELAGLYDTNRTRIRMADIGSRTAMYQADRSVEIARWQGAPMRIATFGALMRG